MHNELLRIGPFTIYGYGLMIAIGIIIAYVVAEYRAKRKNLQYEQILSLTIWCLAGGFLTSKLLYWMIHLKEIVQDPTFLLYTLSDGFVVYGGILGGILAGGLYGRYAGLDFLEYFDLMVPSLALAQGFGRIGCFLAGCCYGKATASFLAVTFHESAFAPNGIPLIPTQLYSSGLDFLNAIVLLILAEKSRQKGVVAGAYLVLYSVGRFILEYFRGDLERGSIGILTTSQFLAIFTLVAGIILLTPSQRYHD